jgi:hypothetical protein
MYSVQHIIKNAMKIKFHTSFARNKTCVLQV